MKKSYMEFQRGVRNLQEVDVWFPVRSILDLTVGDTVRVSDGLVKIVSIQPEKDIFYGEIITKIHDEVKKGEVYEYHIRDTQILGKKKNKNKVSFKDLSQIDDISIRHKTNDIDTNPIIEKYLNDDEISKLISKVMSSVGKIIKDKTRDKEERETGKEVLDWVKSVKQTYTQTGSLHPNTVSSLMKTVSGLSSKNKKGWGFRTKGWKSKGDGKVPGNFKNEELEEGLTKSITRGLGLRLKSIIIKIGRNVRSQPEVEDKLDLLSKQISSLSGLVLLSVSVSGDGLLSKSSIISSLFTEDINGKLVDRTD